MISIGEDHGNSGAVEIEGLVFTCYSNGQNAVTVRSAFYTKFPTVRSQRLLPRNAVGPIYDGSCSFALLPIVTLSGAAPSSAAENRRHPALTAFVG